ncbi:MAG: hypothetical protein IKZ60_02735, partial [Bacteroidales bacterium]|nr:hypothetical protein [Bacteroidales bacterium]
MVKMYCAPFATGLQMIPHTFAIAMKQKDHLPFFGIGPYYVAAIAVLTAVGMILSRKGYLNSGLIPALKTPMLVH